MSVWSASDLIALWERGRDRHPLDRGLLALLAAHPDPGLPSPADWPLGRRNRALLDLHRREFGPSLGGWVACAICSERMEFGIDVRDLVASGAGECGVTDTIVFKGWRFRPATSRDLAETMQPPEPAAAALRLLDRCRTDAGDAVPWMDEDVEAIGERMADADPLSEIRVALACPQCGHASEETLDPVRFLWSEIEARARRSVLEVHTLASAYGWSEAAILAMIPARRALYLDMVQR